MLNAAIQNVRNACSGISNDFSDMKRMAGINTAVTGVGTAAGGVALGTGIAKKKVDQDYETLKSRIATLISSDTNPETHILANKSAFYNQIDEFIANSPTNASSLKTDSERLKELEQKSKTLGNIRTGTLAGTAAIDAVGTVVAVGNRVNMDLKSKIASCVAESKKLATAYKTSVDEGMADVSTLLKAEKIARVCSDMENIDFSQIDKRATGAAVSSGAGAILALAGTATSASANSDKVRNDNSDSGKQKEKNLNTASNVLAGGATVTSLASVVFNATQIKAIKKAASIVDECEEALK